MNQIYPDLLTVEEVGELFHLCRQSVYKYIRNGSIPAFKNPVGKYLIPRKYIEDLINGCYNTGEMLSNDCLVQGG